MVSKGKDIYEFENFRLDVAERLLEKKGKRVELSDRAFDVLAVLVRNAGRLVTKDRLLEEVWGDTFVEENSINKSISLLRKSLGAGRSDAKFIETVRGRGFRFVAKVAEAADYEPARAGLGIAPVIEPARKPTPAASVPVETYPDLKHHGNVVPLIDWRPKPEAREEAGADEARHEPARPSPTQGRSRRPYLFAFRAAGIVLIGVAVLALLARRQQPVAPQLSGELRSMAVLPFKPLASEARDETFEMGMADTLISKLSASRQMTVRPLSAVRRYASIESDELDAGRALGVDAVLAGSIQRSSDKVRINVRLLKVSDGSALWSGTFDGRPTDIFSIQDDISHQVVSALKLRLGADEELQLAKRYTSNPQAYEYFLRGRAHYFRLTFSELQTAADYFQKAIDADPNYALAYVWLAEALRTQSIPAHVAPAQVNPRAKQNALKALELDETLADAHISLAWVHLFYDWDWAATEREARRAMELAPNNSDAHRVYAHLLSLTGRHEEAISEGRRARELAPLTLITASLEGQFLMFAGRLDEAEYRLEKTLEIDPSFWIALNALAKVYYRQGRQNEAIETMRRARETSEGSVESTGHLAYMLARAGDLRGALRLLEEIRARGKADGYERMFYVALVYNGLGNREETLTALEKAFEQREAGLAFIKFEHPWDAYHAEPRFQAIIQKMHLQ